MVALLGDGAATGGMVYEALNDAAVSGEPLVVVLNDNTMSIDRSVGGLGPASEAPALHGGIPGHEAALCPDFAENSRRKGHLSPDPEHQGFREANAHPRNDF